MVVLINTVENEPIRTICADHGNRSDELIEILHAVQERDGYLGDAVLRTIADRLNISHAEIHGVVSFYHDFYRQPPAKTVVKICRAEACQAVGCEDLAAHAEDSYENSLEIDVSIEAAYCLGNCALGPAVMIGQQLYGRVTQERLNTLIEQHVERAS